MVLRSLVKQFEWWNNLIEAIAIIRKSIQVLSDLNIAIHPLPQPHLPIPLISVFLPRAHQLFNR